jgi:hypothetical protein
MSLSLSYVVGVVVFCWVRWGRRERVDWVGRIKRIVNHNKRKYEVWH